jgi:hypothetical protein
VERRPYRGPGRRYSVPEVPKHMTIPQPEPEPEPEEPREPPRPRADPPMVRTPDYDTSHEGAQKASESKENIQRKLLAGFYGAGEKGFTDEECAEATELTDTCFWKRCGELRAKGYIEFTGEKRKGRKGVNCKVSRYVAEM